jgi:hypothetical protein
MSAIKENGFESFCQNYYWPVPNKEFNIFSEFIHNTYVDLILGIEDDSLFDIAHIELSFVANLLQIFHYNYVNEFSLNNNIELLHGQEVEDLLNPDWSNLSRFYSSPKPSFGKVKRFVRRVAKNIVFNRNLSIFDILKSLNNKDKAIGIGSMSPLKMEFILNKRIFTSHYDYFDLINIGTRVDTHIVEKHALFFEKNVVDRFIDILQKNRSLFTNNIDFDALKSCWKRRFYDVSRLYFEVVNTKYKSNSIFISDMATPFHKLITLAFQRSGKSVYCFHHGNDAGFSIQMSNHERTISHCHTFVVPTDGIQRVYERIYSKSAVERRTGTKYLSINSSFYNAIYSKNQTHKNTRVKKIMLMGYPMNHRRYPFENGLFFYSQLDLEYRLITTLKSFGYYVIYKAHPDRLKEIGGVFNNVDEYITQPFEAVYKKADLLLFTYTSTSTFGYALTTNLPIILVDSANKYRDPDQYKLMQSRVNILDAKEDTHMKIQFNEKSLINMVSNENVYKNFDFSYVDQIYGKQ